MDTEHLTIVLPYQELIDCALPATRFVELDEHIATGNVRLRSDGARRTWTATGPAASIELRGGTDTEVYELLLPARLLHAAALVAGGLESVTLVAGAAQGRAAAELRGSGGVVGITSHPARYPTDHPLLVGADAVATALVDVRVLREALALASLIPSGFDPDHTPWPVMEIRTHEATLSIDVDWGSFGTAHFAVSARTQGTGRAYLMPGALAALLDVFPEAEIVVGLPATAVDPVTLSGDGWTGRLQQVDLEGESTARLEEVLVDAFGPAAADADRDGVYPLRSDPFVGGRIRPAGGPVRLEVLSPVLDDVEESPELWAELNDHNQHLGLSRVTWQNGSIVVQADVLTETITSTEVRVTAQWVARAADELAPVLAVAFGGTRPDHTSKENR